MMNLRSRLTGIATGDQAIFITRDAFAARGWRWEEPATLWDVDRPADLDRLAQAGFPWPIP